MSRSRGFYHPMVIRAKAAVDPRGAVALMEALPKGGLDPQSPAIELDGSSSRRADHLPGRTQRRSLADRLEWLGHRSERVKISLKFVGHGVEGTVMRSVTPPVEIKRLPAEQQGLAIQSVHVARDDLKICGRRRLGRRQSWREPLGEAQ